MFTCVNIISSVESLRLGGAEYTDFTFVGNTVTLVDAPTISLGAPRMDYFISSDIVVPTATTTFIDGLQYFYEKVGESVASELYPISLVRKEFAIAVNVINNMRANPREKISSWTFNKPADKTTTGYSAVSILTDNTISDYIPSAGKVIIGHAAVVKYTSFTSTAFIGTPNFVYESGETVSIGYPLIPSVKRVSEVLVNGIPQDKVEFREWSSRRAVNTYCEYEGFLFFPYSAKESRITVLYIKNNTAPVLDSDLIDIENDYWHLPALYALKKVGKDKEDARQA